MSGRDALVAEYAVLDRFDFDRALRGHDYGAGQRGAELRRRRHALNALGVDIELELVARVGALGPTALLEAFERVGRPKLRRIERESYRLETPATRRTLQAWRQVERGLAS